MELFLTSSLLNYDKVGDLKVVKPVDNSNGLVDQVKKALKGYTKFVFVCSNEYNHDKTREYARITIESFKIAGISFNEYYILDGQTMNAAEEIIKMADFIYLCGGECFEQIDFFNKINLKELLSNFNGVIMGQSAGAIDLAEDVYCSPEEINISEDKIYMRGLGLTDINIEPHFDLEVLDDDIAKMQREHILEESKRRSIYALKDGSHIYQSDSEVVVYGDSYLIENGEINVLTTNGNSKVLNGNIKSL